MYDTRYRILAATAALFLFLSPELVNAQERAAESRPEKAASISFDGKALARTVETLNSSPKLDFNVKKGENVFLFIAENLSLDFEYDVTGEIEFSKSTTFKSEGKIGQFLVELLRQIDCEYSLRPDGVLVIRQKSSGPRTDGKSTQAKIKRYVENMINHYD